MNLNLHIHRDLLDPKRTGIIGGFFALPWCCILPAILSGLGLAGFALAQEIAGDDQTPLEH